MNHDILRDHPEKWKEAIQGYAAADSFRDLANNIGGHARYLIRETKNNTQGGLDMRLGGILVYADPRERYVVLKNPGSNTSWSVQMQQQKDGKPILNLWDSEDVRRYKKAISKGTFAEIVFWVKPKGDLGPQQAAMRDLVGKLKSGEYKIVKKSGRV
jgi:hypothetical protein